MIPLPFFPVVMQHNKFATTGALFAECVVPQDAPLTTVGLQSAAS